MLLDLLVKKFVTNRFTTENQENAYKKGILISLTKIKIERSSLNVSHLENEILRRKPFVSSVQYLELFSYSVSPSHTQKLLARKCGKKITEIFFREERDGPAVDSDVLGGCKEGSECEERSEQNDLESGHRWPLGHVWEGGGGGGGIVIELGIEVGT